MEEAAAVTGAMPRGSEEGNRHLRGFSTPFGHRALLSHRASEEHILGNTTLNQRCSISGGGILGRREALSARFHPPSPSGRQKCGR